MADIADTPDAVERPEGPDRAQGWDDFFAAPGAELPDRSQPACTLREFKRVDGLRCADWLER